MKKYIAMAILGFLIAWGIYDLRSSKDISGDIASHDVSASSQQTEENEPLQNEPLKIGLAKGSIAPDFELRSLDGEIYKLSDLRGKKVIVNFWRTGCPSCRIEMPDMEKFYREFKDNDVEILAINLTPSEEDPEDVPALVESYSITFPVLLDEKGEASNSYKIYWIPDSYIIDAEGIIRERMVGPMTYDWLVETINAID